MEKETYNLNANKKISISNFIETTLAKIAPKKNIDTSIKQQWSHLDVGTAVFVICIIVFSICFSYLIPTSYNSENVYNIQFIALIVSVCFTFIFPLSWVSSIIEYPSKNTKYYILTCLFVGIIFEFVSLLMTMLTNKTAQERARDYNAELSPSDIDAKKMVVVSPKILLNNQYIYILFTTTIVLMIGCISTYFYDEVTIEKDMISTGVNIKPVSTMGSNIHWWLTFFYEKANDIDNWWHSTMNMFQIPSVFKMLILLVIGFFIIFFIFVDLRLLSIPAPEKKIDKSDYILDKNGNPSTSLPNTKSPLMQNGVLLLYGDDNSPTPAPVYKPVVYIRYLPNIFTPDTYSNINLFGLLSFFLSFLFCILIIPILYGIHSLLQYLFNSQILSFLFSPMPVSIILIVTFLLSFLLLFFFFPTKYNVLIIYFLITFVFSLLSAPIVLMFIELFALSFGSSLTANNIGWFLFFGLIIAIWTITFSLSPDIFRDTNLISNKARDKYNNVVDLNNDEKNNNSNVLQLFTVLLIAMTVGWFFGLSFHFDVFTFLFILVFTPIKYVLKIFGPIAILGLTITQIILASESSNLIGKTTAG